MIKPVHPALDVIDDTLYLTAHARVDGGTTYVILSSAGEVLSADEWREKCQERGLLPISSGEPYRCSPRWHAAGMREVLGHLHEGRTEAITWREAYVAVHRALDERLQMWDARYLAILSLFCMMTYVHPLFDFLPILHLRGPAESGKSRAGHAIAGIAFNGMVAGYATPSALFRNAHMGRYTQIITEADHLERADSADAFVRQLQSACSKAEARVELTESGRRNLEFAPKTYHTFCPRVILSTTQFRSQPLRSRCIRLDLVKSLHPDQIKLHRSMNDDCIWAPLRDRLYRLTLMRWREVATARDELGVTWIGDGAPEGRTFEKWLPLAAMASVTSPEVLAVVQELACEDVVQQRSDIAERDEAFTIRFALSLIRDRQELLLSSKALYEAYIDDQSGSKGDERQPEWACRMGLPFTTDELIRRVRTPTALVHELQRLKLMGQSKHTREGNRYHLARTHILSVAAAQLGQEEVSRLLEELALAA